MRFHVGKIAPSPAFDPGQGGWQKVREPGLHRYYLVGLPVAAVTFVALIAAIAGVGDTTQQVVVRPGDLSPGRVAVGALVVVGGFVALLLVHEGIHLLTHPGNGRTSDSVVGVWPSRGVLYAHYDGEIRRNRFLLMVALPFLLLSALPVAVFWAVGKVYLWLAVVALVNGVASCFDLVVIAICVCQVPGRAVLRNHGWDTYWRPANGATAESRRRT